MAVKPVPMASEGRRDPKSKKNSSKKDFPSQSYGSLKFFQFALEKLQIKLANCQITLTNRQFRHFWSAPPKIRQLDCQLTASKSRM
jgi:hypothetical protein